MFKKGEGEGFNSTNWEQQGGDTVIAPSVKVEGDFFSEGNVIIEGQVKGNVGTSKDLMVGEKAKILADVTAANALVAGEIRGNVKIDHQLELRATARIHGDIAAKVLIVTAGAEINGHCSMGGESPQAVLIKESKGRAKREVVAEELA